MEVNAVIAALCVVEVNVECFVIVRLVVNLMPSAGEPKRVACRSGCRRVETVAADCAPSGIGVGSNLQPSLRVTTVAVTVICCGVE